MYALPFKSMPTSLAFFDTESDEPSIYEDKKLTVLMDIKILEKTNLSASSVPVLLNKSVLV